MSLTVERTFQPSISVRPRKGAPRKSDADSAGSIAEAGRVPRITRLMALVIKFEGYIQDGVVQDYAELARLGGVSRARMTQIMNLTLLAPDIQEALLNLPRVLPGKGRDPVCERHVRSIAAEPDWNRQRVMWAQLQVEN